MLLDQWYGLLETTNLSIFIETTSKTTNVLCDHYFSILSSTIIYEIKLNSSVNFL